MAKEIFYDALSLPTSYGDPVEFDFESNSVMIVHDGTGDVEFSFDKVNKHGELKPADQSITFDGLAVSRIFLKSTVGTDPVRVWAWRSSK